MNTSIHVLWDRDLQPPADLTYRFEGAEGETSWPRRDGALLGATGAWNMFWRLGHRPIWFDGSDVPSTTNDGVLVVSSEANPSRKATALIQHWLDRGGWVIASGLSAPRALGDVDYAHARPELPVAGLAYLGLSGAPALVAPAGWSFAHVQNVGKDSSIHGRLGLIHGEAQTPERALITPISAAPAMVVRKRFVYLNANVFAAFQAWLQGQEDLAPWLQWRHRLFWLDEYVAFLDRELRRVGIPLHALPRPGIKGLPGTTVVLRHDLDDSRDTSYLDLEDVADVPAVHAVLDDDNLPFWLRCLESRSGHEAAFHYNTTRPPSRVERLVKRLQGRRQSPPQYLPDAGAICAKGLLRQVLEVQRRGLYPRTLHRHASFLIYPEWIDALDFAVRNDRFLRGGSSLFRGQVLRWGIDRPDGMKGTLAQWPDSHFPLWLPFKLADAGKGGRMTTAWETTSIMEPEPELVAQLLDHQIPELPQRVLVLNYHPAHANRPTFRPSGSLPWFRDVLELLRERAVDVRTLSEVYDLASAS